MPEEATMLRISACSVGPLDALLEGPNCGDAREASTSATDGGWVLCGEDVTGLDTGFGGAFMLYLMFAEVPPSSELTLDERPRRNDSTTCSSETTSDAGGTTRTPCSVGFWSEVCCSAGHPRWAIHSGSSIRIIRSSCGFKVASDPSRLRSERPGDALPLTGDKFSARAL